LTVTRRRLAVVCLVLASSFAIGVACSFPDVEFRDGVSGDDDGGSESGGGRDTGTPDSATEDAGDDAPADGGGMVPETAPPLDATSEKPDTGACADPCDCDKDLSRLRDAACAPANGGDCDDNDSRAFPGQNFRKDLPTQDTKGDWNCDGTTERLYKVVNVSCGGITDSCPGGRQGLAADIPCGTFGEYVTCGPGFPIGCNKIDSGIVQQECR